MKYLIIFFICFLFNGQVKSETCIPLDSIRIMGFERDMEFLADLTRCEFLEYIKSQKEERRSEYINYVDTIITRQSEIDSLFIEMNHLHIVDTLSYNTSQINSEIYYSPSEKEIKWHEHYNSDYRLVMLLFYRDKAELVWLDNFFLEKKYFRYRLSKLFLLQMSKYTHLYDDAILYYETEEISEKKYLPLIEKKIKR